MEVLLTQKIKELESYIDSLSTNNETLNQILVVQHSHIKELTFTVKTLTSELEEKQKTLDNWKNKYQKLLRTINDQFYVLKKNYSTISPSNKRVKFDMSC